MESTYGGRFHKNTGDHVEEFARVIQETLDKGGNVVIPAFAVGRTQEVLNYIRIIKEKNLVTGHGVFPVYLDSPMAVEATGVFKDNMMDCYNEETKELVKRASIRFLSRVCISRSPAAIPLQSTSTRNRRLSSRQPACVMRAVSAII